MNYEQFSGSSSVQPETRQVNHQQKRKHDEDESGLIGRAVHLRECDLKLVSW